jgi:hypothetical protein
VVIHLTPLALVQATLEFATADFDTRHQRPLDLVACLFTVLAEPLPFRGSVRPALMVRRPEGVTVLVVLGVSFGPGSSPVPFLALPLISIAWQAALLAL